VKIRKRVKIAKYVF